MSTFCYNHPVLSRCMPYWDPGLPVESTRDGPEGQVEHANNRIMERGISRSTDAQTAAEQRSRAERPRSEAQPIYIYNIYMERSGRRHYGHSARRTTHHHPGPENTQSRF